MISEPFAAVGILIIIASVSLVLLFSDDSVSGLAQFSVERCFLPAGFEANFSSKNECLDSLHSLCSDSCPNDLKGCIRFSKRQCGFVGRSVGGVFG